jgi:long-chain acyl-CoA synthetase
MLDLRRYASLGEALRDAMKQWPGEVCLIEADRDRELQCLTYAQFGLVGGELAAGLQELGFPASGRAAILMTNQSKWLISACALFWAGAVIVPLDYKLSPTEQAALLAHSQAETLIIEFHLWRAIVQSGAALPTSLRTILVTEAPAGAELGPAKRWEECQGKREMQFVPRRREDPACIVYSSGTGGQPKGCILTHANYIEQCIALTALFPFWPGVRYLSILPTNHAIDFMVGFIGPFVCGAAVVHLRTLRPEYIREAFKRYRITYATMVPMMLKNLERGMRERFSALTGFRRALFGAAVALNRFATRNHPHVALSRKLLPQVHQAFGGELRAIFVGGAFTEPSTLQFFYNLGILVGNAYGCTEAGTAITLNDLRPFRADTVGKPLPGVELRIEAPDANGVGEVVVKSPMVMSRYLDEPELTAEAIRDGWLYTGDLGREDRTGHLQLFGRKKNMIVTAEGKNIYPEDIENVFDSLPVEEFGVFAANYIWPARTMLGEELVLVVRIKTGAAPDTSLLQEVNSRNRRLLNYKRVSGVVAWDHNFPRTASLKIKRHVLAEEIRSVLDRNSIQPL